MKTSHKRQVGQLSIFGGGDGRRNPDGARIGLYTFALTTPPTSRAAAIRAWPRTGTQRRAVLDFVTGRGDEGATDEEIMVALQMSPNAARPRRNELMNDGWVVASGHTRRTSSNTAATVWVRVA